MLSSQESDLIRPDLSNHFSGFTHLNDDQGDIILEAEALPEVIESIDDYLK